MTHPKDDMPTSAGSSKSDADLKRDQRCSTCRELILRGAKKCTKCDSYQDWRRHLTASTAILALLVSSMAGLAAAGPTIYQALRRNDSDLSISSIGATDYGKVRVLLRNSGKQPGVVSGMTIALPVDDVQKKIWLHPNFNATNGGKVPPDGALEVEFEGDFLHQGDGNYEGWDPMKFGKDDMNALRNRMDEIEKGDGLPKCNVVIDVSSFKGEPSQLIKALDCRKLQDLLRIYWEQAQTRAGKK